MAVLRKVASIIEEGEGTRIIWEDGKEDFTADKELIKLASEAWQKNLAASVGYESKGWDEATHRKTWAIKKIELIEEAAHKAKSSPELSPKPSQSKSTSEIDTRAADIHKEGKPLASMKPERQYGRDEDRVDQRTFVMEVGADIRAGVEVPQEFKTARRLIMASWLNLEFAEKPQPIKAEPPEQPVKNAKELMAWALKHGKEYTPSWVRKQVGAGTEIITDTKAVEYYQFIKEAMGWED